MDVYITDLAAFLPNDPVENDDIEKVLGVASHVPSRTRKIILRNNKIRQRYYAIDPATGQTTHSNAQLAAEAVKRLRPHPGFSLDEIECLCCGTSSPDQILPGHASMVHGELGMRTPCEVVSTSGVCVSGMTAMKYAFMTLATGLAHNAVAVGSDIPSTFLRAQFWKPYPAEVEPAKAEAVANDPGLAFEADFLRWMLSDGAGAACLSTSRRDSAALALRVDWIDNLSFAHELETCMYAGAIKNPDGSLTGWREFPLQEAVDNGAFLVKQDVRLLNREVVNASIDLTLSRLIRKRGLQADDYAWFAPHYSSEYFRQNLFDHMRGIGFDLPLERWFTNLQYKGNTGAAAIYIILEELFHSGKLKRGDKLLGFVPESGRFCICYMQLTVV